ncbi:MAG: nucleoside hydrolase-like domain-containing protein [Pedobacter sp.]
MNYILGYRKFAYMLLLPFWMLDFTVVLGQVSTNHRVIILSDIEADPDDTQSLVRLLLYSNQIDIKGLIATTSVWQKDRISPESIKKVIRAYGKVQPNLNKHEPGFPNPGFLMSVVKNGATKYGMLSVGKGQESEGSKWIIKELEKKDGRPLYVAVWGGVNTLAQALFCLRETKSAIEIKQLVAKLRIYTISDQDDSGIWLRNNFPDLQYVVSPGDDYGSSTWVAINSQIKGISNHEISNKWIADNIQQGHGALGALYPDVSWGVEGDTPSFLNLIPNGLNNPEHPDYGGWGGRYELLKPKFSKQKKGSSGVPLEAETHEIWTDTKDNYTPFVNNAFGRALKLDTSHYNDNKATLWRWRGDFQNDFAARMNWCLADYKNANHPPVPVLKGATEITVRSGEGFRLDGSDSNDPDGDNLSYLWFNYPEAGSYKKDFKVSPENYPSVWITAPRVDKIETAHIILKVTDKGAPNLSRYKRIIVTIEPK